jgi:hypothetical protein
MFMKPAGLSDQSFDTVAYNTVSHLFADGNPDSVSSQPVTAQIQDEVFVYKGFTCVIAIFKICVLFQRFHNFSNFIHFWILFCAQRVMLYPA